MKSKNLASEPLQVRQSVCIQKQEKTYTWSEEGQKSSMRDHEKWYYVIPNDGSSKKLHNRRHLKPKEPRSYKLSNPLGLTEVGKKLVRVVEARRSKSLEEISDGLKPLGARAPLWTQGPGQIRTERNCGQKIVLKFYKKNNKYIDLRLI